MISLSSLNNDQTYYISSIHQLFAVHYSLHIHCRLAELAQDIVNNVSSANSVGVKFDACGRSFTYKANNRGPSDEPWGTPRVTPQVVDLYPLTTVGYIVVCLANN